MKNSMRVFAAAGVALLCVSTASAQESGHLTAEFLKQATPLIHWPKGLEPRNVDVFVHNEGWIDAPLAVAVRWPKHCTNAETKSSSQADARATWTPWRRPIRVSRQSNLTSRTRIVSRQWPR